MARNVAADGKKYAFSTMTLKAVSPDGQKRKFTGVASTPDTDFADDVVVPEGASYKLPIPLLAAHDSKAPLGWVTAVRVSPKGIEVDCEVHDEPTPGTLKDRLDEQWQSIKAGLVRGLSIGFIPIEYAQIEGSWGVKYLQWAWTELSTCVVACNSAASITAIKSLDREQRAALGLITRSRVVRLDSPPPGVSGTPAKPASSGLLSVPKQGTSTMNIAERIAAFKAKKLANDEKISAIVGKSIETGETLSAEDKQTRKDLMEENAEIDDHLVILADHEKKSLSTAVVVDPKTANTVQRAVDVGAGRVVQVKSNLPVGTGFTRIAIAVMRSKGNLMEAAGLAEQWQDSSPEVGLILRSMSKVGSTDILGKAAVNSGDTNTSGWASQLVYYNDLQSEFIGLLRPKTIIGRIAGLRHIPFNVRIGGTTSGTTSSWVGENQPIPMSSMVFNSVLLGHAKAASLVAMSRELVEYSSPQAESVVRDDMIAAMTQFLDAQFIDPSVIASANVSPASVTNGSSVIVSTGATVTAIYTDVQQLLQLFDVAELDTSDCVWVMKPGTARALSMKRTSQDIPLFPDITMAGGTWFGLPVITSNSVPGSVSGGTIIALVKASEVFFSDDGGITLDVSQEASLQMVTNPQTGAQSLVSLFQNGQVALRAVRDINWAKRRAGAVAYLDGVFY